MVSVNINSIGGTNNYKMTPGNWIFGPVFLYEAMPLTIVSYCLVKSLFHRIFNDTYDAYLLINKTNPNYYYYFQYDNNMNLYILDFYVEQNTHKLIETTKFFTHYNEKLRNEKLSHLNDMLKRAYKDISHQNVAINNIYLMKDDKDNNSTILNKKQDDSSTTLLDLSKLSHKQLEKYNIINTLHKILSHPNLNDLKATLKSTAYQDFKFTDQEIDDYLNMDTCEECVNIYI
jgi:hypothetical protein